MRKNFNYVLDGQLSGLKGEIFEGNCTKYFIKNANKKTMFAKNIILDFSIYENKKLHIIDAKNYKDESSAYTNALSSLKKITSDTSYFNLKVIVPKKNDNKHIPFSDSKDKNFINSKLKIKAVNVDVTKRLINDYFNLEEIRDDMRKKVWDLNEYKKQLKNLNNNLPSDLAKYFINIHEFSTRAREGRLKIKKWWIKVTKFEDVTVNDLKQEMLKDIWKFYEESIDVFKKNKNNNQK